MKYLVRTDEDGNLIIRIVKVSEGRKYVGRGPVVANWQTEPNLRTKVGETIATGKSLVALQLPYPSEQGAGE